MRRHVTSKNSHWFRVVNYSPVTGKACIQSGRCWCWSYIKLRVSSFSFRNENYRRGKMKNTSSAVIGWMHFNSQSHHVLLLILTTRFWAGLSYICILTNTYYIRVIFNFVGIKKDWWQCRHLLQSFLLMQRCLIMICVCPRVRKNTSKILKKDTISFDGSICSLYSRKINMIFVIKVCNTA